jgi:very-short-patch-repair endonuclease
VSELRALLTRERGPALTRSEAEERLLALVRQAGLPAPECNVRIAGHEVDFLWRASRLIVEVDGYAFHGSRDAFERDRRRDAELQAVGLTVVRLTWRRLVHEPEAVVALLARRIAPASA